MILRVDPSSPIPPYEQIRAQIATMIGTGVLLHGARLPAIRQLAADLGLAGGTVARAYRELESGGAIVTRGRHGTFVDGRSFAPNGQEDAARLGEAARSFALQARQLGVAPETALASVKRALEELAR
ncbi:MAG: GntR family transcriptional regulator [Actinomycetota bacterium]